MNDNAAELAHRIVDIGRRIDARGFAAGNEGNISVRLADGRFLCTPSLVPKGRLTVDDLVIIDAAGHKLEGIRDRSSEALLHLAIYAHRPDCHAVVHTHPVHVTAFALTHTQLPRFVSPEVEVFLGEVALTPYETPGTEAFARSVIPYLDQANALILANHGMVSYAADLEHAFWWTEILDAHCRTLLAAKSLGELQPLPLEKRDELIAARELWAAKLRNAVSPSFSEA